MKFLFHLNHPAHFHLFKNTIIDLTALGHEVIITIRDKDILRELIDESGISYEALKEQYRKKNLFSIGISMVKRELQLLRIIRKVKPDILAGTSPELGQISPLVRLPCFFFAEDDVKLTRTMYWGAFTYFPFFKKILSPIGCDNARWNKKTIHYPGYHKLAYLHPNRFTPNYTLPGIPADSKLFLLRLSSLSAYHDKNTRGISNDLAENIIKILEPHGIVLVSSERPPEKRFEKYMFKGHLNDIHHYIARASLFISDGQSMIVEAAMLGTPNIRFNDFIGRISVLNELEKVYQLSYGIPYTQEKELIGKIEHIINDSTITKKFLERKQHLLKDKIDVSTFFTWFFNNYPESLTLIKKDKDIFSRFLNIRG